MHASNVEAAGVAHGRQRISAHGTQSGQRLEQHWPAWLTTLATPASDRRRLARLPSVGARELPGVGAREHLAGVGARERPVQERASPSGQTIPDLLDAHRIDVTPVPAVVLYNVHACNTLSAC